MTLPRYAVESRYQDEGWETASFWATENDAFDVANRASYNPIAYGMVRVVDTQTGTILREYGAGSNGEYTVPTTVAPIKPKESRVSTNKPFYVVTPTVKKVETYIWQHDTEEGARHHAEMLVNADPGLVVYVSKVVGEARSQKTAYTEYPKEGPVYRHEKSVGWSGPTVRKEFS